MWGCSRIGHPGGQSRPAGPHCTHPGQRNLRRRTFPLLHQENQLDLHLYHTKTEQNNKHLLELLTAGSLCARYQNTRTLTVRTTIRAQKANLHFHDLLLFLQSSLFISTFHFWVLKYYCIIVKKQNTVEHGGTRRSAAEHGGMRRNTAERTEHCEYRTEMKDAGHAEKMLSPSGPHGSTSQAGG